MTRKSGERCRQKALRLDWGYEVNSINPLFPEEPGHRKKSYLLPPNAKRRIEPSNPAVEMIRRKIDNLYDDAPNAQREALESKLAGPGRSKHQQFMYNLTTSGRSMAEIQTEWHNYYVKLPDAEKHEVWQEFYSQSAQARQVAEQRPAPQTPQSATHKPVVVSHELPEPIPEKRSPARIKQEVLKRVKTSRSTELKAKQHLQSLAFGLGIGALVLLIALFGLFNEMVLAPFIKPSSKAAATPIILNSDTPAPSDEPELIIPKINVQLPVIYGGQSLAEADIQKALESGVYHYPTTAVPGQKGNAAYFGHSSNNIFNKGRYKFAFVLLKELEPGDIFYLTYDGKVYTYRVYSKKVVTPEETWVLNPVEGKVATATLITCDPPGTTLRRLVVWGEQITPDPNGNSAAVEPSPALQTQELPDNGPTVWSRFWSWVTPW